jgi:crotonobetainyl-CoA:carnitine CoA-transferase CaiB-like acyl-CoA transferase
LIERRDTGVGRRVQVSLFDVMVDWMTPLLLAEQYAGGAPDPAGLHHATISPYGAYSSADGELVNIAVQTEEQWERFCDCVLKRPELKEVEEYSTNERRSRVRSQLDKEINGIFSLLPASSIEARLEHCDVPWGRVRPLSEVLRHPQLLQRRRWIEVPIGGDAENPGQVARLLASPLLADVDKETGGQVSTLGQDTTSVLREVGYDDTTIQGFFSAGVIAVSSETQILE